MTYNLYLIINLALTCITTICLSLDICWDTNKPCAKHEVLLACKNVPGFWTTFRPFWFCHGRGASLIVDIHDTSHKCEELV